jgi:hypothetical protein
VGSSSDAICTVKDETHNFLSDGCIVALETLDGSVACVNPGVLKTAAYQLMNCCVESRNIGGCLTVENESNIAICAFTPGKHSCDIGSFIEE